MVKRKLALISGIVCLISLTGCAGSDISWNAHRADAVGVWAPALKGVSVETRLSIREDGTFTADSWPRNLMCAGPEEPGQRAWGATEDEERVDWARVISFDGRWRQTGDLYRFVLYADMPCNGGDSPQLWKRWLGGSALELRFYPAGQQDEANYVKFEKQE